MARVILDAGHGGMDGGAAYNDRLEKEDNLRLALAVGERLGQAGVDVVYTRDEDRYDTPIQKAQKANALGGDLFVSFHRNASPVPNQYSGVETLVFADRGLAGEAAHRVNEAMASTGFENLGVSERPNLVVLRRTQMPAILLEAGFLNNDSDNARFDAQFDALADAIAGAILETEAVQRAGGTGQSTEDWQSGAGQGMEGWQSDTGQSTEDWQSGAGQSVEQAPPNERYRVQVGLYRIYQNAAAQAYGISQLGYPAEIVSSGPYYAVWVGDEETLDEAVALKRQLQRLGYETLVVAV